MFFASSRFDVAMSKSTDMYRCVGAGNLTPREAQVASWLVRGKTNREIAIILDASVRTIEKHVESVLRKLQVENRTTAAIILATWNGEQQTG